jgi:hypothetical protein
MQGNAKSAEKGSHALAIILQQWNIQYHTTQGMNTRIAALFAFSGVVLGFLLQSDLIQRHDPLAMLGAAFFLGSVLCLLWAAWTRWAPELPPVGLLAARSPATAAKLVEAIVRRNQELLREKGKWLKCGLVLTALGLLTVTSAVLRDSYSDPQVGSIRWGRPELIKRAPFDALPRPGVSGGRAPRGNAPPPALGSPPPAP